MLRIVSHGRFEDPEMPEAYTLFWRIGIEAPEKGSGVALSRLELLEAVADFVGMSPQERAWRKRR